MHYEVKPDVHPWRQVVFLENEVAIAKSRPVYFTEVGPDGLTPNEREIQRWQRQLDKALSSADESGILRCSGSCTVNGVTYQCVLNDSHPNPSHWNVQQHMHPSIGAWTDAGASRLDGRSRPDIGRQRELEIYNHLLPYYPRLVLTNTNAIGVDIQSSPDIDIQSKAMRNVGPKEISHFADSSEALLKLFIADGFTKQARIRAVKRSVILLTMKEFYERYPGLGDKNG
jgi:hypothetical protein